MWPFKKQVPKVDLEKEALHKRLKAVEVFAPLGSIIEYLGVKMMVVGHNDFILSIYAGSICIPCLKLEWMDCMQRLQRTSLRDYHFCLCKVISTPENKESVATIAQQAQHKIVPSCKFGFDACPFDVAHKQCSTCRCDKA